MSLCPRDRLLSIVKDIELISKEMFEYFLANKQMKQNLIDGNQLAELLVKKDYELKLAMKSAQEQEYVQSKIEELKKEVQEHDEELQKLQQSFKEAELILATAIYQAKQKLFLIKQADSHPIYIEELIKYAHKISADHSVASPYNWEIGDQRRPYPTDLEMKSGLLVNPNEPALSSLLMKQQNPYPDSKIQLQPIPNQDQRPSSAASASGSPYSWGNPYETNKQNINSMNSAYEHNDAKQRDNDEVEVMSTDSSSTSSSDSQ